MKMLILMVGYLLYVFKCSHTETFTKGYIECSNNIMSYDELDKFSNDYRHKRIICIPKIKNSENLLFRGMSIQNIINFFSAEENIAKQYEMLAEEEDPEKRKVIYEKYATEPVFRALNAKNPDAIDSKEKNKLITDHIDADDLNSPYISFEKGYGISLLKYAPKPVDGNNIPEGIYKEGVYHKLPKSYTYKIRENYKFNRWIGYAAGVDQKVLQEKGVEIVDLSTYDKAFQITNSQSASAKAAADIEVLLNPGENGIMHEDIEIILKIKLISYELYDLYSKIQNGKQAVGFIKEKNTATIDFYQLELFADDDGEKQFDVKPLEIPPIEDMVVKGDQFNEKVIKGTEQKIKQKQNEIKQVEVKVYFIKKEKRKFPQ